MKKNNKSHPFSRRTQWSNSTNTLSQTIDRLRQNKIEILDLTESNPTRCGFDYPEDKILKPLAQRQNLIYAPQPQGSAEARQAICEDYAAKGYNVSPQQIFLTSSTSEAYAHIFRLLANPHERVIFPKPSYPLFEFLVDLNDIGMDRYALTYDRNWSIDFPSLKGAVVPQTKAVAVVNPNNPTGSYIHEAEREMLNSLCSKNQLAIISDEVFFEFAFDPEPDARSFVSNQDVLTFTLGGLSKSLGLPQMKLSWVVVSGPPELVTAARSRLEIICDTFLSVNIPAQNALAEWFKFRPKMQEQILTRVKQNWDFLKGKVSGFPGCQLFTTEGGWYAVLKIPETMSEEEWCLKFLEHDHVLVHPGYFFDFDEEAYLVISLLPELTVFQEAVDRLLKRISRLAKSAA